MKIKAFVTEFISDSNVAQCVLFVNLFFIKSGSDVVQRAPLKRAAPRPLGAPLDASLNCGCFQYATPGHFEFHLSYFPYFILLTFVSINSM